MFVGYIHFYFPKIWFTKEGPSNGDTDNGQTHKLITTQLKIAGGGRGWRGKGLARWSCVKVLSSIYVVFVIGF